MAGLNQTTAEGGKSEVADAGGDGGGGDGADGAVHHEAAFHVLGQVVVEGRRGHAGRQCHGEAKQAGQSWRRRAGEAPPLAAGRSVQIEMGRCSQAGGWGT